tara:strand:+ start:529 stop:1311 length:783 start_codon:yes stop_codon:yes gene_type:complete
MRVLVIADETPFYQPSFIDDLAKDLKKKNIKVYGSCVIQINKKNDIEKYLITKFYWLNFKEILILASKKIFFSILNFLFPYGLKNNFFSTSSAFKRNKIDFFKIKKNINKEEYYKKIKDLKIDLIINSSSLIFGKKILNASKFGCLNRHTSLLPAYAGLWPVIHAISNNEKNVGVSIHEMTSKIDSGKIYAQKKINISSNKNVLLIYKKAFSISSYLIIKAINNKFKKKIPLSNNLKKSYYSFPTKENWLNFRKNGGKFF